MVRTQIQLTAVQARALKELASERGVSMSEVIRQGIDRMIAERDEEAKWSRASRLVGRYRSGTTDVSVNHDEYLADAYHP